MIRLKQGGYVLPVNPDNITHCLPKVKKDEKEIDSTIVFFIGRNSLVVTESLDEVTKKIQTYYK